MFRIQRNMHLTGHRTVGRTLLIAIALVLLTAIIVVVWDRYVHVTAPATAPMRPETRLIVPPLPLA
jgi:hypothetical protein